MTEAIPAKLIRDNRFLVVHILSVAHLVVIYDS